MSTTSNAGQQQAQRFMFTSDLSVNEFLLLRKAGFMPLGLVMGTSIYHIGVQSRGWSTSQELDQLSQAMYNARELAMGRMEEEAERLGADGVVGVNLNVRFHEFSGDAAEFIAIGTAVRADVNAGSFRNALGKPFTSDLSGQDFWTLTQTGYQPQALVMGTCVYHIAHRSIGQAVGQAGQPVELENITQAMYNARELAMKRMEDEAQRLSATGVVGTRVVDSNHHWSEHAIEFLAIGTAVTERPGADGVQVDGPTPIIAFDR